MQNELRLNEREDLRWLRDTHLRGLDAPTFLCALVYGNEDCPDRIELYAERNPTVRDTPIAVYELSVDDATDWICQYRRVS